MSVLQRISFIFWTHIPFKVYSSWPFQTLPYNKNSCAAIPELQRFLQMVNSFGKFIPNFAEVIAPLREFLKKDVVFNLQKNPVRRYRKVENFDYICSHSKKFQSKLTNKIKSRCKFWRIRSTSRAKPCLVKKLATKSKRRIFVKLFTWIRRNEMPKLKNRLCIWFLE